MRAEEAGADEPGLVAVPRRRSNGTRRGAFSTGCGASCRVSAAASVPCAATCNGGASSWEAQVDWYEAWAVLSGERVKLQVFEMRSMAGGASYHRAYTNATQQAFLEAHQLAFAYFGGVFRTLRYDNLKSAVKKVLRGHRREETTRFIAFRSHWRFQSEFCNPARGNERD